MKPMERLMIYMRRHLGAILFCLFLVVTESIIVTLIPRYTGLIINEGILKSDLKQVYAYGFRILLLGFTALAIGAWARPFGSKIAHQIAGEIRQDYYAKIQTLSFEELDRLAVSAMISKMTRDLDRITVSLRLFLVMIPRLPISIFVALFIEWQINRQLTLIFLISFIPLTLFGTYLFIREMTKRIQAMRKSADRLDARVKENFLSAQEVKNYVREGFEIQKFEGNNQDLWKKDWDIMRLFAVIMPMPKLLITGVVILILFVGTRFVLNEQMLLGDLQTFMTYTTQIMMSVMGSAMIIHQLYMGVVMMGRVNEVFEAKSEEDPGKLTTISNYDLEFSNVSFTYQGLKSPVLKDISFKVPAGSSLAIIGETGSGKSSLVQLIPRLYEINGGSILIGNTPIQEYSLKTLRDHCDIILQQNTLFSGTIRENLQWGDADASDEEMEAALKLADAWEFVQKKEGGLEAKVEQEGTNFSGGQRQRLCITRSLLKKPNIMVFDDCFSALDMETGREILRNMATMHKSTHGPDKAPVTRIIISQRIENIKDADQILVLNRGQISGLGTHQELYETNDIYRSICTSQQMGLAV